MLKYPEIHRAQTSTELFEIAEQFAKQAGIAIDLTTWPGTWPSTANDLRWESCKDKYDTETKENMLMLANLLMEGESRHTTLRRLDRARQEEYIDAAWQWLKGWIDVTNEELKRNPEYARNLDCLTSRLLCITYARALIYSREDHHQAMNCAIKRELELFLVYPNGKPTIATGTAIKALTNETHVAVAVLKLKGRRI